MKRMIPMRPSFISTVSPTWREAMVGGCEVCGITGLSVEVPGWAWVLAVVRWALLAAVKPRVYSGLYYT